MSLYCVWHSGGVECGQNACMRVCASPHVRCEQRCYCCATVVVFVFSAGKRNKRSVRLDSRFCPSHDSCANTCCYQYLFIYPHKSRLTMCVDTSVGPHKHTGLTYRTELFRLLLPKKEENPTKCQHFQHCGFGVMGKIRSVVNSSYFNILLYNINYAQYIKCEYLNLSVLYIW